MSNSSIARLVREWDHWWSFCTEWYVNFLRFSPRGMYGITSNSSFLEPEWGPLVLSGCWKIWFWLLKDMLCDTHYLFLIFLNKKSTGRVRPCESKNPIPLHCLYVCPCPLETHINVLWLLLQVPKTILNVIIHEIHLEPLKSFTNCFH